MKKIVPFLFLIPFFSSCDDEIDLTAPYKDITVVYGLLDRNDTIHYIRIQKAYLVDENAFAFAGIADSTYYPPTLNAYILEYNASDVLLDSFHLERTVNELIKDSGLFASSNNVLYKGLKILNPANYYQLVIIKPNGDTSMATTHLCPNIVMRQPPPLFANFESNSGTEEPKETYSWASDPIAYFYQLSMYFNYEEWVGNDSLNPVPKKVARHFNVFKPDPENACDPNMECFSVTRPQFYSILLWNIPADPAGTPTSQLRHRRALSVDVKVSVGSQDLYYYIKFNAPSLSYVQKLSTYTNMQNGLGIFASRTSGGYTHIPIHPSTLDSIVYGTRTQHLNFQE
jgi:hypothetical protein